MFSPIRIAFLLFLAALLAGGIYIFFFRQLGSGGSDDLRAILASGVPAQSDSESKAGDEASLQSGASKDDDDPLLEVFELLERDDGPETMERAETLVQTLLETRPDEAQVLLAHGRLLYMHQSKPDEARPVLEQALKLAPNDADIHFHLGSAIGLDLMMSGAGMMRMMREGPLAVELFERAAELNSEHVDSRMALCMSYLMMPAMLGGGRDKAEEMADAVLYLDRAKGFFAHASIHHQQGELEEAIASFQKSLAEDATDERVHNMLGYALIQADRPLEALPHFEKAVELKPHEANGYDSLGDGLKACEKFEAAIASYDRALELDPEFSTSVASKAELLIELGREDEAAEAYRYLLSFEDSSDLAESARDFLESR